MDFWKTVLVVCRRWYISLPVFALSVIATGALYSTIPLHYTSSAVLVLATPLNGGTSAAFTSTSKTNPLLNFRGDLVTTADILSRAMNTTDVIGDLTADETPGTAVKVSNRSDNADLLDAGPFIFIQSESPSARSAERIVDLAAQQVSEKLESIQRQVGAPKQTYVTIASAVTPTKPQGQTRGKARAALGVLGFGLPMSILSAFMTESFVDSRRRRRTSRPPDAGEGPGGGIGNPSPEPGPLVSVTRGPA